VEEVAFKSTSPTTMSETGISAAVKLKSEKRITIALIIFLVLFFALCCKMDLGGAFQIKYCVDDWLKPFKTPMYPENVKSLMT
jgi:hypothetical protein